MVVVVAVVGGEKSDNRLQESCLRQNLKREGEISDVETKKKNEEKGEAKSEKQQQISFPSLSSHQHRQPVWPVKSRQMPIKVAQKWFH